MISEFTLSQKKDAKAAYKLARKNITMFNKQRNEMIEHLLSQPFPNWNLKLIFLKYVS